MAPADDLVGDLGDEDDPTLRGRAPEERLLVGELLGDRLGGDVGPLGGDLADDADDAGEVRGPGRTDRVGDARLGELLGLPGWSCARRRPRSSSSMKSSRLRIET
ncbi:hypothetical protein ACFQL4_19635 [Halosimplex aquaticum]